MKPAKILCKLSCLLLVSILFFSRANAQQKSYLDKPHLETSATYTTEVTPDRIYMSILITESDTKGRLSVEELENRMAIKLEGLGIDLNKQLTVSNLESDFKKYFLKKTDVLKNKAFSLMVYDAQTAAKTVKALESIEISNIELEKVDYSQMESLKIELRAKAVEKAKKQAESLLLPLNQTVGKALFIKDQGEVSDYRLGVNNLMNNLSYKSEEEPLSVDFTKIQVQMKVTVYFEIE